MLIYAQLEDAVIARLKAAGDTGALGYRFAEVESYGGQFDQETFFTQVRRWPAAWVTVGGDKPKAITPRKSQCGLALAVMVGARNVRGERHTRHGTVGEPGTYQMVQDVRDLFVGQSLGLDISPLKAGAVRTLYNTRLGNEARSVFAVEFAADFTYTPPDASANDPELTAIGLRYYLKPGDDVQDASDEVAVGT